MDEGKSAEPKPKWWSRPRRALGHQRHQHPHWEQPSTTPHAAEGDGADGLAGGGDDGAGTAAGGAPGGTDRDHAAAVGGVAAGSDAPERGPGSDAAGGPPSEDDGQAAAASPDREGSAPEDVKPPERSGSGTTPGAADPGRREDGAGTGGGDAGEPASPAQPLHGADPYGTPPYGGPGPWAPAPLVQRPSATPPQGVPLSPSATAPAHGPHTPTAQPHPQSHAPSHPHPQANPQPQESAWLRYDPWAAPPLPASGESAEPRGRGGARARTVVGAVVLALVAAGLGGVIGAYVERHGGMADVKLPQTPARAENGGGKRAPGSIAGIAQRALPGVVTLHVSGGGGEATGTGFVLDDRGDILTNNHVVRPSGDEEEPVKVTFDGGRTAEGDVVGTDAGYDLAVVRVSGVSGLKPLPLGNSDTVRVGDPVVAIGAPFDLEGTVTSGIISAKERPITAGGEESGSDLSYVDALQTDAPINPGNSGGPLVDAHGRVVGINSAIKAAEDGAGLPGGSEGGSIGLGFAIPVNQGKRVAEELINDGSASHPVIGVTLDMAYAGDGARVGDAGRGEDPVTRGGPADRAGIEKGDVITEVDGERVHSGEELIVKIRSHRPGDRLGLTTKRHGRERSVRLTLDSAGGG